MSFVTITYLIFLGLVFLLYWLLRQRTAQNVLIVLASYFFYAWWDYRFCALMLFSSLIDYAVGLAMARASGARRRQLLVVSMAANLGMLGIFKYYNFFAESLRDLADLVGWELGPVELQILLPVGISFFTFQTMSYTIDIYRGQLEPRRNLVDYLAFVCFFPQLVAGPIERASHLLPQFEKPRTFSLSAAEDGCRLILWGLFKKMVIADNLGRIADAAFADPSTASGPALMLGVLCFTLQIYGDFSGYSDVAIGSSRLFGIDLMRNFAYPYFSRDIAEFWRRWHISLSTWFRDYVFIPLGGSRVSQGRLAVNLLVVFGLSGLWHGANWTFMVWGLLNGAALVALTWFRSVFKTEGARRSPKETPGGERWLPRPKDMAAMLVTFLFVAFTWLFFRSMSIGDSLLILQRMASDLISPTAYEDAMTMLRGMDMTTKKSLRVIPLFILAEWLQRRRECPLDLPKVPSLVRWAVYTAVFWLITMLGTTGQTSFIYFQF